MAIKDLPLYKDIRGSIRRSGRYPYVGTAVKDTHVIHHSLTETGTPQAFANYHIDTNGWHGCAYHFVIQKDGTIFQVDDLDRRTYHAGNTNTRAIGTCLVGDFRKGKQKPTAAQIRALYLLNLELYKVLPNMRYTKGHQECPGYAWKNCPGDNWNYRDAISGSKVETPTQTKPITGATYEVQEDDTLWSIAQGIDGVSLDNIMDWNPKVDPNDLKIGQVINIRKPATTSTAKTTDYTIKAGDTLWAIASRLSWVEVPDLLAINKGLKADSLTVGQKIKIPAKPTTTTTAPKAPTPAPTPSYVGKRVEAKTTVRFYSKPSWDDKDVAGEVTKGLGFTITGRVTAGGAYQYKVKNSAGKVYYITTNTKFVTVK
ncbi:N-acetylmuramoyl-L-alanine amidase precursor [Exiguobacterium phage vB_EalM-132]|nr:N-acetylmuramoyl-L-alanine amidase precursor [Exiguobacterium phage vB_EalM-132]